MHDLRESFGDGAEVGAFGLKPVEAGDVVAEFVRHLGLVDHDRVDLAVVAVRLLELVENVFRENSRGGGQEHKRFAALDAAYDFIRIGPARCYIARSDPAANPFRFQLRAQLLRNGRVG